MEVLDTTIANVALRYIAGGLSSPASDSEWVITSYLAAQRHAVRFPSLDGYPYALVAATISYSLDSRFYSCLRTLRHGYDTLPCWIAARVGSGTRGRRSPASLRKAFSWTRFQRRNREPPRLSSDRRVACSCRRPRRSAGTSPTTLAGRWIFLPQCSRGSNCDVHVQTVSQRPGIHHHRTHQSTRKSAAVRHSWALSSCYCHVLVGNLTLQGPGNGIGSGDRFLPHSNSRDPLPVGCLIALVYRELRIANPLHPISARSRIGTSRAACILIF